MNNMNSYAPLGNGLTAQVALTDKDMRQSMNFPKLVSWHVGIASPARHLCFVDTIRPLSEQKVG